MISSTTKTDAFKISLQYLYAEKCRAEKSNVSFRVSIRKQGQAKKSQPVV